MIGNKPEDDGDFFYSIRAESAYLGRKTVRNRSDKLVHF